MPRYGILGLPVLWREGTEIPVVAARDRTVLSVLLVNADRVVAVEELASALWPHRPPPSARGQIHGCVFRLRRLLGDTALATCPPGYRLRVGAGELDAEVFQTTLAEGRAAAATGEPGTAVPLLRRALSLWRGPALASVASAAVRAEAARLDELRLTAWEECIDLELAGGHGPDLVGELTSLVASYPQRERLRQQLMVGLYQAGRQSDALAAYQQASAYLTDQLGVQPSPALAGTRQRILDRDPALLPPVVPYRPVGVERLAGVERAAVERPAATERTAPIERSAAASQDAAAGAPVAAATHLPPDTHGFVGRRDQLARLDSLAGELGESRTGPVICTITGMAGVGKTTLSIHWAHLAGERFPGGRLYVDLRGFDPGGPPLSPEAAIRCLLDALSVSREAMPASLAGQTALLRGLVAARPTLLVLDNARDAEQVRPLLPDSPACMVLVTSRSQLTGLVASVGAYPLTLDALDPREAVELLTHRLGPARVRAEAAWVEEIVRSCARLPLALALVAARAATHSGFSLAAMAEELRDAGSWFDTLDGQGVSLGFRGMFASSYRTLGPEAAQLFRLLSLHPGPQVTVEAAASLQGTGVAAARRLLAELAQAHMVVEQAPGRFAVHDLLRAYAAELVSTLDPEDGRRAARLRLYDHLLHTADAADRLLDGFRVPVELVPPRPGVAITHLADSTAAHAWFVAEHAVLVSAVLQAAAIGCDDHAWQIAWAHSDFLFWQGHCHDLAVSNRAALDAARRADAPIGQAHAHRGLAGAATALGRHEDAYGHLEQALDLFEQAGSWADQAHVRRNYALVLQNCGRYAEALEHSRIAYELYAATGDIAGQARSLHASGWSYANLGEYERAMECCRAALSLHQRAGDESGAAFAWGALGYTYLRQGDHRQAITCLEQAYGDFGSIGEWTARSNVLLHLGDAYQAVGDTERARDAWQKALEIRTRAGDPGAGELRAKLGLPEPAPTG